ncbi:MAG: LysM peptidoglycan-binding domain-containing protein [Methylomicrobium sp.]|nr:LysM peptidoglycan-binding domain-containing protein [Methylomicrobium sp.]
MPKTNSNRSLTLFSFLILTLSAGCTQQPTKSSLSISQKPPLVKKDDYKPRLNKLKFAKSQKNSLFKSGNHTIWERLVSLYALPKVENERIDKEINWFLKNPEYLVRVQKRAEPYLHLILEEIESKNIPGELALLPVVESAFRPDAYSPAHASGLWQFIPETGRLYGLKQNNWYDGRRDVYASTQAATKFLKDLGDNFEGDWLLALASYNWGRGNVQKSIDRNLARDLPTDYWSLKMPNETFNYVPRLLAVAKIFANPDQYNIPLYEIPDQPYFEVVYLDTQLDLKKAAELAQTSVDEIKRLNPAFKRNATAPNGPHRLLIPVDQVSIFKENLAKLPVAQRYTQASVKVVPDKTRIKTAASRQIKHKIRPGESLGLIARKYKTSVGAIRTANRLGKTDHIQSGKSLIIPATGKSTIAAKSAPNNAKPIIYTVKPGDTFWKISRQFSVSTQEIYQWNKLNANSNLRAGQKLTIHRGSEIVAKANSSSQPINYTVQPGDSLTQISRKFKVPVSDLLKWNSTSVDKILKPGQQLKVLADKST